MAAVPARLRRYLHTGLIEATAFWLAIVLPIVYLPMLATGIGGSVESLRFALLLAVHALCLFVGHSYHT